MSHHRGARWGPQTERLVQTSDQIKLADLNCKAKVIVESKEIYGIRQSLMLGGGGGGCHGSI
jgi:hypothetical protein